MTPIEIDNSWDITEIMRAALNQPADISSKIDKYQKCQKETFFPFSTIILANEVKEASPNWSLRRVRTQAYLRESQT